MHPLFDVRELSDDDLSKRIDKAHGYLAMQTGLGHTPAAESIKFMLDSLYDEKERRTREFFQEAAVKKDDVIELGKLDD